MTPKLCEMWTLCLLGWVFNAVPPEGSVWFFNLVSYDFGWYLYGGEILKFLMMCVKLAHNLFEPEMFFVLYSLWSVCG